MHCQNVAVLNGGVAMCNKKMKKSYNFNKHLVCGSVYVIYRDIYVINIYAYSE